MIKYTLIIHTDLMKRRDLIKKLTLAGFVLDRNGGNHDIYIGYNIDNKKVVI